MDYRSRINRISPNLDDLLIFFLALLLIISIIVAPFISFDLFLIFTFLAVSFLSLFILCVVDINKIKGKYEISKLSLFLVLILIPSVFVANLTKLSFFLVYGFLVFIFFLVLVYLIKKERIIIK